MKKIQNARILTNQQMKHISGGWSTHKNNFGTINGNTGLDGLGGGGGGTCPVTASKDDCKGECDLGVGKKTGTCLIYRLAGNDYCACVE